MSDQLALSFRRGTFLLVLITVSGCGNEGVVSPRLEAPASLSVARGNGEMGLTNEELSDPLMVPGAVGKGPLRFKSGHGGNGGTDTAPRLLGLNISGVNRLLICVIAVGRANAQPLAEVSNVVLDDGSGNSAQPLIQLGDYYSAPQDGARWSTWYLVAPTVGANRRVIGSAPAVDQGWVINCVSYSGADQTTPFGDLDTAQGVSTTASLTLTASLDGSLPWAHLLSSNAGYVAGAGATDRQLDLYSSAPTGALVDGNVVLPSGGVHTFAWSYSGEFGAQGAMIRPATAP